MAALLIVGLVAAAAGAALGAALGSKTTSENIANESVKGLISITNTASQTCKVAASQIQSINITGNVGGKIVSINNWDQFLGLNNSCLQSNDFRNNITQSVQQMAEQLARSISQQFQLGSTESKNVVNATAELAITVSNSFIQGCSLSGSQIMNATISGNRNVDITISNSWQQYNQSVLDCVQQNQAVNNASQQLQQIVNQTAESTVQNFFAILLGIIFAIFALIGLIIFAWIFFRSGSSSTTTTPVVISQQSDPLNTRLYQVLAEELAPSPIRITNGATPNMLNSGNTVGGI